MDIRLDTIRDIIILLIGLQIGLMGLCCLLAYVHLFRYWNAFERALLLMGYWWRRPLQALLTPFLSRIRPTWTADHAAWRPIGEADFKQTGTLIGAFALLVTTGLILFGVLNRDFFRWLQ